MTFTEKPGLQAPAEAEHYPHLDALLGGYFHQDFDLFGDTLAEILATYREDTSAEERAATRADIERFLGTYGPEAQAVNEALERIFKPGVIIEGWDGLNATQWLEEVARLLA
ncbi:contact-dependent growth inhibition system immunity protein [Silvibacterium dinghuense]|uniref:ABC transporter ATP-binding protein n=1 Tax=Silvibacterium dinghuense TaxID=1560006 RepID=A0A4Q1S9G1_9BACT|nr:contact-dependent growth inhibition system immunity protein [Silvibacterium dinghuense]RXS93706.1 ABC transporter ATP-binding protein [Silvibacterium dinghuense]GGH07014.1 hypothetical protein GCM10011586_24020 [Silvibacterium dinghuense]